MTIWVFTSGYGDSDVLNLSSKSDSREDLSEHGGPAPICNSLMPPSGVSPSHQHLDKDEPLSDNDFDDKNGKCFLHLKHQSLFFANISHNSHYLKIYVSFFRRFTIQKNS